MKTKVQKKEEAQVRNQVYSQLTTVEKIAELDKVFGKDQGASKQRAKLAFKLEKEKNAPAETKENKKAKK